eukprot:SAG11_NODE_21540_length_423_cov_0.947531_1_plen_22_part_10
MQGLPADIWGEHKNVNNANLWN